LPIILVVITTSAITDWWKETFFFFIGIIPIRVVAGGMGLMIIKLCASASAVVMATPVAAIIGGVVALNLVSLKIQLMFSPIAHINI
jgi:hypothetical protein